MAPPPETSSAAPQEASPKSSVPPTTSIKRSGTASPPPPPSAVAKGDGEEKVANTAAESVKPEDTGGIIDTETLDQILELDEGDHEFSRGMVWAYFEQIDTTFEEMNTAYDAKDLKKLSELGHFLKGSSAALGVSKVQLSCAQIQHYGELRDEDADLDLSEDDALSKIGVTLERVKKEYAEAERWLRAYYAQLDDTH